MKITGQNILLVIHLLQPEPRLFKAQTLLQVNYCPSISPRTANEANEIAVKAAAFKIYSQKSGEEKAIFS